jgi:hypothetical protein
VSLATGGDAIVMAPGAPYTPGAALTVYARDIGGQPGMPPPVIQGASGNNVISLNTTGATIHDVVIQAATGGEALSLGFNTAERVAAFSNDFVACNVTGATLRDTLCVSSTHDGIDAPSTGTTILKNVTAINVSGGVGLGAIANFAGVASALVGTNVIASGGDGDVQATVNTGASATVTLANSNYGTVVPGFNGSGSVTQIGTNGNQTAAPLFVNAAGNDFREAGGSPTIDAGLAASDLGSFDLDSKPRSQPSCLGGPSIPDIGAYEFAPSSPPRATCSLFTLGKLKLNKKKGTGELHITVPGSGSLKASAKGMKKSSANPTAAGDITLKLKASGKSKRKLADKGKLKLKVKLAWTPTGGVAATQTAKVKLKKK